MGTRGNLHKSTDAKGAMVPVSSSAGFKDIPLLPYERQLIDTLGCTVEEYKDYRKRLINAGTTRPAGYEAIPDIRCDPVSIVVSIVVGAVLSAVSALLAPKPKQPDKEKERNQKRLASESGPQRFNATSGFDSVQQIAEFGQSVPLLFGRYNADEYTGGLSTAPRLVWSRMFSHGSHQGFKGIYAVGEALGNLEQTEGSDEADRPEITGIQFGTNPLDSQAPEKYAVYWNPRFLGGRIRAADLLYGTRAYPAAGDPETSDDCFLVPLTDFVAAGPKGFCMANASNGNQNFGAYNSIPNGTAYLVNWKVVSIPSSEGKDDEGGRLRAERLKIAGKYGMDIGEGMKGKGRGYVTMMGIKSCSSQGETAEPAFSVPVNVGDELDFVIRSEQLKDDQMGRKNIEFGEDTGVTVDDINNSLNTRRTSADQGLQIGEVFMIGRTLWQVTARNGGQNGVWTPEGSDVTVRMRMIETTTDPTQSVIGVAGNKALGIGGRGNFNKTTSTGETREPSNGWVGETFWNLCKADLAVVRNVRPAEMTEIGIRSQVWNQANGLCNFQSVPNVAVLNAYDKDEYSLTTGYINKYFKRTSVFTIYLRPISTNGQEYKWRPIGEQFCVTGERPVDQFNFIRIKTNDGEPRQMEFRFVPKTNADIRFFTPPDATFWRLNARSGVTLGDNYVTEYGTFRISCVGDIVTPLDITFNAEFRNGGKGPDTYTKRQPTVMELIGDNTFDSWLPSFPSFGRSATWTYEAFGDPKGRIGQTTFATLNYSGDGKTMEFVVEGYCADFDNETYENAFGTNARWFVRSVRVNSASGGWDVGFGLDYFVTPSSGNYFANNAGWRGQRVGARFRVTNVEVVTIIEPGTEPRVFSERSQLAEISHFEEVTKSCDNGPEHSVVYVNESVTNPEVASYPFSTMGLGIRSGNALKSLDQLRVWLPNGVHCTRFAEDQSQGPSNLFSDLVHYVLTNPIAGVGQGVAAQQWVDNGEFTNAAKYLKANKIYFDAVLEDRVNVRQYLTQTAQMNLCMFVIKNGMFSCEPALPYDSSYRISGSEADIPIAAMFNMGNIIDGSFSVDYLDVSERQNFKAVVKYRVAERNTVPREEAVLIRWAGEDRKADPQEVFDITDFCTSREQALMLGRYLLSVRQRVDHAISFETTPYGLQLAPGDYIKVAAETAPTSPATITAVGQNGELVGATELADGLHKVLAYLPGAPDIQEIEIEVLDNRVADTVLFGALFSSVIPRELQTVYQVEELTITEDGLVKIVATHHPVSEGTGGGIAGGSIIAKDTLDLPYPDGNPRFFYGES